MKYGFIKLDKFIAVLLILCITYTCCNIEMRASAEELSVTAQSAAVIEYFTDTVLYSKDGDRVLPMASTTKIATAVTVLENEKNLDRKVKVSPSAAGVEGSSMYLKAGEEISIRDLLYGLMLVSGNDAATVLAETVLHGGREEFICAMNSIAAKLNLSNTHFMNPSGLPEEGHHTTAIELAKLTSYALTYPEFEKITSAKEYRVKATNVSAVRLLLNHNKLLRISGLCVGGKTGFTAAAGRCLVSIARKDGVTVIAVTLNAPDDWNDHMKMYDKCIPMVSVEDSVGTGELRYKVPVIGGKEKEAVLYNGSPLSRLRINGNDVPSTTSIYTDNFVYAPITPGQMLGTIISGYGDKTLSTSELLAEKKIEVLPPSPPGKRFINYIKKIFGEI